MNRGFVRGTWREFKSPLYRNAIFLMANTVLGGIPGLLFLMVVARFHSPWEVGLATAIIPVIPVLAIPSKFVFDASLMIFLPLRKELQSDEDSCFTISRRQLRSSR